MEKMKMKEKIFNLFKSFGKITIFIGAIFLGYISCEIYHIIHKEKNNSQPLQYVRGINETSVAINERGELMIIDRNNGKYITYEDSVCREIFLIYSASLQNKYKNP
jgi:hypothetical protein